jgi:hypothetical protein
MFIEHLTRAIEAARPDQLDHLARELWRAYSAGTLDEAAAQVAAGAIEARRAIARAGVKSPPRAPARRRQRSPDRQASIERRRRMVGTIALPPHLACKFTWGEQAVLRVIGDRVRKFGCCDLPIDAIAAMAGVHRTTVQNAIRRVRQLGLATVQERRRRGQRSLTNVIHIISREWSDWLRLGPAASRAILGEGSIKKLSTTNTHLFLKGRAAEPPPWGVPDGVYPTEEVA